MRHPYEQRREATERTSRSPTGSRPFSIRRQRSARLRGRRSSSRPLRNSALAARLSESCISTTAANQASASAARTAREPATASPAVKAFPTRDPASLDPVARRGARSGELLNRELRLASMLQTAKDQLLAMDRHPRTSRPGRSTSSPDAARPNVWQGGPERFDAG
jgi:hypothetical protein